MDKQKVIQVVHDADVAMMNFLRKQKAPVEGIRYKDISILQYIYKQNPEHQTTISDLANYLKITTAAASQGVSAYEKQGLVKRIRSEKDRRVVYVQVSEHVLAQFESKMNEYNEIISRYIDYLGEESTEQFCELIEKTISFFEVLENE